MISQASESPSRILIVFAGLLIRLAGSAFCAEPKEAGFPAPIFLPAGGIFTNTVTLQITAAPPAVVRFSLNGTEPNESSPVWSGPLVISNCTMVRASSFFPLAGRSRTVCNSYTILANDLRDFTSNLPVVIINAGGGEITHLGRTAASLQILEPSTAGRARLATTPAFDGSAWINVRGHYSLRYPKHSYAVKTADDDGDAVKVSILGFPKQSEWVLYAPFPDKTLIRDVLAYELSNKIGDWAPRTRFVEVFVNEGSSKLSRSNYVGVYVFEEKIKRDKNRVNIAKLEPAHVTEPEITGGYIFKKDHGVTRRTSKVDTDPTAAVGFTEASSKRAAPISGPGGFPADPAGFGITVVAGASPGEKTSANQNGSPLIVTNRFPLPIRATSNAGSTDLAEDAEIFPEELGFRTLIQSNQFFFVDPGPDELTGVQKAWLKDYLNSLEITLSGPGFADPQRGYRSFIDPASFIDHHILVEATKNVDGFRFSTFYYKDRNEPIKMGPLWDWNLSFGNANGKEGWLPQDWLWPQLDDQQYTWFRRLFDDPDFAQAYVDRWTELRQSVLTTSNVLVRIEQLASLLDEAQQRNFERWPILGRAVTPNWFVGNSYEDEIQFMAEWTRTRLDWIDNQFVAPPEPIVQSSGSNRTVELKTREKSARLYFTLDGTDPRSPGGQPNKQAKTYEAPIPLPATTNLFARALEGNRWSGPTRL